MSFTSFEDADDIVDRFINLLHSLDIHPAIGSKIEDEFLSPLQLLESTRNLGALANNPELRADAGGMYDFAAKLLAVETQPEFKSFIPHLKLFEAVPRSRQQYSRRTATFEMTSTESWPSCIWGRSPSTSHSMSNWTIR
jgi:hypothetical protein